MTCTAEFFHAFEIQLGQPARDRAAVIGVDRDGDGPGWELRAASVECGEAGPAFERDLPGGFVETHKAVAVGALALVLHISRIRVSEHRDPVAEAIAKVAGPQERADGRGTLAGFLVERAPPAAVDGVDDRGAREGILREGIRAVDKCADAVLTTTARC